MGEKESAYWRKHIPAYGESSPNAREIIIISYISGNEGAGGGIFEGYKPFLEPTKPLGQWISYHWILSPPLVVVLGPFFDLAQYTPAWGGAVY